MKRTVIVFLILFTANCFAADRYVRAGGNDANSGLDSTNAWASVSKVNSFFSSLSAGDHVYFHRGDTFYGTITIAKSGTSSSPITIGAFGTGAKPIITGFTTISGWTNEGGGIYSKVITSAAQTNMVTIDGVQVAVGRYPDTTYLTYNGSSGANKIWKTGLGSTTNWTGANVAVRKNDFIIERCPITAHLNDTLTYTTITSYTPTNGFGFFIENDLRTLTTYGEWYHNTSTGKFYMYFGAVDPTLHTVKVATLNSLITVNSFDYFTIENLNITGAINNAIDLTFGQFGAVIQNDTISFAGNYGINTMNATGSNSITGNTISNVNSCGLYYESSGTNTTTNNTITRVGLIAGQAYGRIGGGVAVYEYNTAINFIGNTIRGVGYNGIFVSPTADMVIQNSLIDSTCMVMDDGGAIYTAGLTVGKRRYFDHNIITNIIGNRQGTSTPLSSPISGGIYLDESNSGVTVSNNSISNSNYFAIKLHKAKSDTIINNTGYNNATGLNFTQWDTTSNLIRNNTIKNNIFLAKSATQIALECISVKSDQNLYGAIDSNYYARPIADSLSFFLRIPSYLYVTKTLAQWQSITSLDAHSHKSPKTIASTSELNYQYNATSIPVVYSFPGYQRIDVYGNTYNDSATIPSWGSKILIDNGTSNTLPIAHAGVDQTITLPVNSVALHGTGTDADGTVVSYSWFKLNGNAGDKILHPNSDTTTITFTQSGTYNYVLTVTDNSGGTGTDTVKITINPAILVAPTVNAGTDQTLQLPISASLSATVTGNISNVTWSFISVPVGSTAVFGTPTTLTTSVTGLSVGTYSIKCTVLDFNGLTAKDTVQLTVLAPPANIPPTVDSIAPTTIQLPVNYTSATAVGRDVDGTIASYAWVQTAGPNAATISSASTAGTNFTGLVQGYYTFKVTVTDNSGATGSTLFNVTVLAAIVVNNPPVVTVSGNVTMTLPTNSTTLSATATDTDGTIASTTWRVTSAPGAYTFGSSTSLSTTFSGLVQGVYTVNFKAIDNSGDSTIKSLQVTVLAAPVIAAPSCSAGTIGSYVLPIASTVLTDIVTVGTYPVSSYAWTQTSGLATTITNGTTLSATITGITISGNYIYQFKATDDHGNFCTSSFTITALDPSCNCIITKRRKTVRN